MERNDRCDRWSNILGANRRFAIAKSSIRQENYPDAACLYVHTSFNTYKQKVHHGTAQRYMLALANFVC